MPEMSWAKFFTPTVTAGNVVTAAMLAASAIVAYSDLRASVKDTDERLTALEKNLVRSDADHDLLIRIDTELGEVRAQLTRQIERARPAGNP
jgi:type VI protein secretion system component VasK